jgi:transketolase
MSVIVPADVPQARSALQATWDLPGPVYYRLSKDEQILVPQLDGRFELGQVQMLQPGDDVLFLAMGPIVQEVLAAAAVLAAQSLSCAVGVVASIRPEPVADLQRLLGATTAVVTAETHYQTGGLGSLVAETMAESACAARLVRCGVRTQPDGRSGSQAYMHQRYGLACDDLVRAALSALGR